MNRLLGCVALATLVAAPTGCETEPPVTLYYTYVGSDGRAVYASNIDEVPQEHRASVGTIDVHGIYADQSIAERIANKVRLELTELRGSVSCAAADFEDNLSGWRIVWYRYGPWILAGLGILFLLILTPSMTTALPAGMWTRVLFFLIPGLLAIAILAVTAQRANNSLQALRELNAICDNPEEAQPIDVDAQNVVRFRHLAEQLYRQRTQLLDDALRNAGIKFDGN